jgi:hypothetical protein
MWPFLSQNSEMKNHFLLSAAIAIPLQPSAWQSVSYDDIPSNKLSGNESYLEIIVEQSASPLVYKLDSQQKVHAITFTAELEGKLSYGDLRPGEEGADDFPLRVGLVVAGDQKLNRFQKWLASDWVLKLHDLAAEGEGIDHVLFLNLTSQKEPLYEKRVHPLSDLFHERIIGKFDSGMTRIHHELEKPQQVLGLWISSDGDDTGSSYKVKITDLNLMTQEE